MAAPQAIPKNTRKTSAAVAPAASPSEPRAAMRGNRRAAAKHVANPAHTKPICFLSFIPDKWFAGALLHSVGQGFARLEFCHLFGGDFDFLARLRVAADACGSLAAAEPRHFGHGINQLGLVQAG